jgi:hypothetical protein
MDSCHFFYRRALIFLLGICCVVLYSDQLQVGIARKIILQTDYHHNHHNCRNPLNNSKTDLELNQSLSIRGTVNLSAAGDYQSVTLKPSRIMPAGFSTPAPTNSTLSIELIDQNGSLLAQYPTDVIVSKAEVEEWKDIGYISEAVPFHPCTAQITINNAGEVLAIQNVSANSPEILSVRVTDEGHSPRLIFPRTSNITVGWEARDLDNDDLTYLVLYSNDGGSTWPSTIADDLKETSVQMSANSLEGNSVNLSKFRVIATDGINTDIRDSDPFSVPVLRIGH